MNVGATVGENTVNDWACLVTILDPPINQYDEPKEVHTQLTVDLLLWADSVASGRSASEVAVLFSTDRECRPAVRRASERLTAISSSRVGLASWAGQEHSQLDAQWFTNLMPVPIVHPVSLPDYERRENKRRRRRAKMAAPARRDDP